MLFAASVLVASFGYLLASSAPVYAADATWEGDNVVYEGAEYEPLDLTTTKGPKGLPNGVQVYQYAQTITGPIRTAKLIYFDSGVSPKSAKEATYIQYTLNPPNDYSNPTGEKSITLTPAPSPESTSEGTTSCAVDNVGWLVCGLGGWIAGSVDSIYRFLSSFLIVEPVVGGDNSMYRMWEVMRNFANLAFIIGFMVVIYSYLVGGGFSSYEIKKIVPRLVVAAILINASYWICAIAVDISNIAGASLQELFISIRDTAVGDEVNKEVSWTDMTTFILSGGTVAVAGLAFMGIAGGSIVSLAFMLLGVLITIAFALFVALIIMAARQAIIIVLVVLAPLAFAAYVLPNTEKYFEKWRSVFITMLLLFPIFSILFGGSQLASAVIVQNADNLAVMLFGMAIQIVPLVITPLLIQFSGGLIGRIAGVVNNGQKGLVDRSKGWTQKQADYHKDRNLARENNSWNRLNFARRGAQGLSRAGKNQEDRQKNYQSRAENMRHRTGAFERIDTERREAEREHKRLESLHTGHWNERNDPLSSHRNQESVRREFTARNAEQWAKETESRVENAYSDAQTFLVINPGDDAATTKRKNDHNAKLRAQGLTADLDQEMIAATATAQSIAVQALRKKSAEVVSQGQLADTLKANVKIRPTDVGGAIEIAAGIDPNGKTKVEARATADLTALHMENVKAVNSIFSNDGYTLDELFEVIENKKLRKDASGQSVPADEMHIHAAVQQVLSEKGNNWGAQKLHDFIAMQSIERDSNGDIIDSPEEAARKRDLQQIYRDAHINSGLKLGFSSGTDKGFMATGDFGVQHFRHPNYSNGGQFETMSEYAIFRDIQDNKIKPERLAKADIDELMRMVQVMRKPELRSSFTDKQRQTVLDAITEAHTNDNLKGLSSDREKDMMRVVAAYLDPTDPRPPLEKETVIIEENGSTHQAELLAPTYYDPTELYGYGDPRGPV